MDWGTVDADDDYSLDTCRYCRAEPCRCDEIYDTWRDRQMEKERGC